jgi:hypothetical protein
VPIDSYSRHRIYLLAVSGYSWPIIRVSGFGFRVSGFGKI